MAKTEACNKTTIPSAAGNTKLQRLVVFLIFSNLIAKIKFGLKEIVEEVAILF